MLDLPPDDSPFDWLSLDPFLPMPEDSMSRKRPAPSPALFDLADEPRRERLGRLGWTALTCPGGWIWKSPSGRATYTEQEAFEKLAFLDRIPSREGCHRRSACCSEAGKSNGYGLGDLLFRCPANCACHD